MTTVDQWWQGARPRTLPAAIAPVLLGTATAIAESGFRPFRALLALVVALALQVGANYANDYSDGIRGTDDARVGPVRLVGQGLASPTAVRTAALASFAVAATTGLALVVLTGAWWLLAVGALAIAAAWLYTGGRRPYGYAGLGELAVFVFFGLVAVTGTTYVQTQTISVVALVLSCGVGALAVAILVANNLRDIDTDTIAGKRTLAVRLGAPRTRRLYGALVVGAFVVIVLTAAVSLWSPRWPLGAITGLAAFPLAVRPLREVWAGATGRDLIPVLIGTGRLLLAYAVLTSVGIIALP